MEGDAIRTFQRTQYIHAANTPNTEAFNRKNSLLFILMVSFCIAVIQKSI